jgi:hypothetical protein
LRSLESLRSFGPLNRPQNRQFSFRVPEPLLGTV